MYKSRLYTLSTTTEPLDASRDKKDTGKMRKKMVHVEASRWEWVYAIDLSLGIG